MNELDQMLLSVINARIKELIGSAAVSDAIEQAVGKALSGMDLTVVVAETVMSAVAECLPAIAEKAVADYDYSEHIQDALDNALSLCTVRVSF